MAQLPTIQTTDFVVSNLQTRWSSILNPLIANQLNSIQLLEGVNLTAGVNVINHKLNRNMTGWFITDLTWTSFKGDTTSASTTIANVTSFTGLVPGMTLIAPGVPVNSTIVSLNAVARTMVISAAATVTAVGIDILSFINTFAPIYRSASLNDTTLTLTSAANATVSIGVF